MNSCNVQNQPKEFNLPEPILMCPDGPHLDTPVKISTSPETPPSSDQAVSRWILPLDFVLDLPVLRTIEPPWDASEFPDSNRMSPSITN